MRRNDSVDFVFQLASLVVALIVVHAIYVTVVRPKADLFLAEQAALMATDPDYVQERSVWVIVRDFEQEACFVLMLWAMAIMAETRARSSSCSTMPATKVRSILIVSTGKRRKWVRDE